MRHLRRLQEEADEADEPRNMGVDRAAWEYAKQWRCCCQSGGGPAVG